MGEVSDIDLEEESEINKLRHFETSILGFIAILLAFIGLTRSISLIDLPSYNTLNIIVFIGELALIILAMSIFLTNNIEKRFRLFEVILILFIGTIILFILDHFLSRISIGFISEYQTTINLVIYLILMLIIYLKKILPYIGNKFPYLVDKYDMDRYE